MSLVSKAFSNIITFSRSSNATRIGPTGLVEYAPHNLLTYSEQFDNAAWTKQATTVTANSIASPNGTVTADSLIENSAAAQHYLQRNLGTLVGTYTISFYAKANGRNWIVINLVTSADNRTYFNLSTGVVGTNASGNTATITSVGNGWYRCSISRTLESATWFTELYLASSDGTISYTGDGTSGIYLWGAQLSVGPYPLDYTPTTSAAVYGPRFDYDPVTLAARGLLIEEQRTNLLTYSEQFDNAAWTKQANVTITANSIVAPDGTTTADTFASSSAVGNNGFYSVAPAGSNSTAYTALIYAKAGSASTFRFGPTINSESATAYYDFNLSDGTVASGSVSGFTSVSASITSVGNGWYRCSVTGTTPSSGTTNIGIFPRLFVVGNVYLWGAQLEAGSFATSYIPTVASTVTRSADVASVNTLSPWFNATEGSLYAEGARYAVQGGGRVIAELGDGTVSNIAQLYAPTSSSSVSWFVASGGVTSANNSVANVFGALQIGKSAGTYKLNEFNIAGNGVLGTTDTSGSVPVSMSSLFIGKYGGGTANQWNGWVRRIAYYPRALTTAELQALTA